MKQSLPEFANEQRVRIRDNAPGHAVEFAWVPWRAEQRFVPYDGKEAYRGVAFSKNDQQSQGYKCCRDKLEVPRWSPWRGPPIATMELVTGIINPEVLQVHTSRVDNLHTGPKFTSVTTHCLPREVLCYTIQGFSKTHMASCWCLMKFRKQSFDESTIWG